MLIVYVKMITALIKRKKKFSITRNKNAEINVIQTAKFLKITYPIIKTNWMSREVDLLYI